jgi:transcription elongation GreA/GreB family factor
MNKISVHLALSLYLQERIDGLTAILKETYEATAEDSKSSAGDKHETAVSMAQLEQEKLTKQINEFLELQSTLLKINPERKHASIELGSLVETNNGWYYFSIGLGAVQIEGHTFFAMNPLAPIGKLLLGKRAGEKVEFNGNVTEILSVC